MNYWNNLGIFFANDSNIIILAAIGISANYCGEMPHRQSGLCLFAAKYPYSAVIMAILVPIACEVRNDILWNTRQQRVFCRCKQCNFQL